jgi:outer membrane lipoprotein-sorting protein
MKLALAIVFALLVATVFISGCVQQQQAPSTGGQPLTAEEKEQQAANTLEQEMDQAIGNMTLEDLENELLTQG